MGPSQARLDCSPHLSPAELVALEILSGLLVLKTLFQELTHQAWEMSRVNRHLLGRCPRVLGDRPTISQPVSFLPRDRRPGQGSLWAGEGEGDEEGNGNILRKGQCSECGRVATGPRK